MLKKEYYFFIIATLFSCISITAQNYVYQHFSVDDGLPSSEVYDVYQDKQGYIWFATDKGLSRYNGYEFKNYTTSDGLPGNTVLKFYPQKNGQIWCYEYHSQKLFYFNEMFDGFHLYQYNHVLKKELRRGSIIKSVSLVNNHIDIGGYFMDGLIKISDKGKLEKKYASEIFFTVYHDNMKFGIENDVFFMSLNIPEKKSIKYIKRVSVSNNVNGFSVENDISVFMANQEVLIKNKLTSYIVHNEKIPIGIKKINDDLFFIGYRNGGVEIVNYCGETLNEFLPNESVSNFLIDNEGGYWFTTVTSGVYYIKNAEVQSIATNKVISLTKDNNDNLFIGFENGDIAKKENNTIKNLYTSIYEYPSTIVAFDTNTNVLYGASDRKIMNLNTEEVVWENYVRSLSFAKDKPFLSSNLTDILEIDKYDVKKTDVSFLVQDVVWYDDTILMATSDGLYKKTQDSVYNITNKSSVLKTRLDDIDVNYNTNKAFIASQGSGVIVYGDTIYNISKKEGISSDIINEVHIENDSIVWACTNSGLNRIVFQNNDEYSITTLTKEDGLISNEIEDVEIINDTVWVGTVKGLCYFSKKILNQKEDAKANFLSLNAVTVNGKQQQLNDRLSLSYSDNKLSFHLQAITYKYTENIRYQYRLKEIGEVWEQTTNRVVSFPSLSPGKYTFEAKACVLNNCTDTTVSKVFIIHPPFWRTSWFYALSILLFSGLIYIFFKIRVLTYNKDVIRELMRLMIKYLKRKEKYLLVRSNGEDIKISTHKILYLKSQGNYLDIITKDETYTIRCKIGTFIHETPDPLEYLRIHKSHIIRIDQVSAKGRNWVVINKEKIAVGKTYLKELDNIKL